MSRRFTGVALTSVLLLAGTYASPAEAQLLGSTTPLAVPVTGSVTGGGTFVGTLSIQRFAVQGTATVAVAAIAGAIVNAPAGVEVQTGVRTNINLPVTVSAGLPIAYRSRSGGPVLMRVSQVCGSAAHIQIGGSMVDLAGAQVMLNPVALDVGANAGGLIGSLVCQVLGLVGNPTMLVGVLNQLLAQLVGLGGGLLGGGLLGGLI
jgi:hypothetical protein